MNAADICYVVLAHADPQQLLRLLAALDRSSPKFVHFDARYGDPLPDIAEYNAEYVAPRIKCFWGGFTLMEATRLASEFALQRCASRRFVLVSGACFPIMGPSEVLEFFEANQRQEFIDYFFLTEASPRYARKQGEFWVSEEHFERGPRTRLAAKALARGLTGLLRLLPDRKPAFGERVAFGSNWWALTRDCLEYACSQSRTRRDIEQFLRWTQSPEEMLFHTLIANSPYAAAVEGEKRFTGEGTWRMANLHVVHLSLAKYYTVDDIEQIVGSGRMFVRKVRSSDGVSLCDALLERQ